MNASVNTAPNVVIKERADGGVLMDCMETICAIHKLPFSRVTILSGLPLKNGELSPSALTQAATKAGLQSRSAKRLLSHINPALLPAILVLADQQACVLKSVDVENDSAEVIYPELNQSVTTVNLTSLQAQYTGYVIFMRPHNQIASSCEVVSKNKPGSWFWSVVKTASALYRDVILASIFISLLSVAVPLFVMNVYDRVVPNAAIETLWALAIGVLIVLLADVCLRALRYYFVELAASRIDVSLSAKLLQKVMSLSFKEKPASTGALVSSLNSFEAIRGMLNSITIVALVDIPFAFILLAIVMIINSYLAGIIFLGGVVIIAYGFYVQKVMRELAADSLNISAKKNGLMTEAIAEFDDVRFFGAQNHVQYQWEKHAIFLAKVNAKLRLLGSSVSNLASWVQQGVGVGIIITGVYLVVDGVITQGGLIAAYLLSSRIMGPMSATANLISQFHHAQTALDSLNGLMAKEEEAPEKRRWTKHSSIAGNISFEGVRFSYPEQSIERLQGLSFSIKAGEHVAILGRNGGGKTSVNRLLLKAYSPKKGLITLDSIDLQQYEPSALRQHIGYVPQDYQLFSGSLKDNLTVFDSGVDEDAIWEVIEACGLTAFVNSHPDGLNMAVGERGAQLSGGKRQSVALGRALLKNPSIFILDEPTSAMDSGQEALAKKLLAARSQNKTLILNTHRATMLDLVDRIIVLEAGQVIADGPKQDVLKKLAALNAAAQKEPQQ